MKINDNYLRLRKLFVFHHRQEGNGIQRGESRQGGRQPGNRRCDPASGAGCGRGDANAVLEMGKAETFRGYAPEQGYSFLRKTIAAYYAAKGVELSEGEVFVSDGAKSDLGNILISSAQRTLC